MGVTRGPFVLGDVGLQDLSYDMKAAGPLPGPRAGTATDPRMQLFLEGGPETPLAQEFGEPLGHQSFRLDIRGESVLPPS